MASLLTVGPGGFPTITAAIAAAADFDTIRVAPGVYNETVIINKSIQVLGAQAGVDARTRPNVPAAESIIQTASVTAAVQLLANFAVFDGFTVQNNTMGSGIFTSPLFSGYWVFNNLVQNNVLGLYFNANGAVESQARRNFFQTNNQPGAATGNGIYSDQSASNMFVDSNLFTGHQPSASINFSALPPTPSQTNIIISNNTMIADNSIALVRTINVKITDNTLLDTQGSSIFIAGGTDRTEIEGNTLHNSVSNGIFVNTVFFGTPNTNIRAKNNSIAGNSTAGLNIAAGSYSTVAPSRRLDATNNWWGSPTGPAPIGTGDAVIDPNAVSEVVPFLTADPNPPVPPAPTIIPVIRLFSSPATTFAAGSFADAVNLALGLGGVGVPAQAIGNVFRLWPEIRDYDAPNNATLQGTPSIIWSGPFIPGERLFFSTAFVMPFTGTHVVEVAAFADNAHILYIEERTPAGMLLQSITPIGGARDGMMDPTAGALTDTSPPYNWQRIRIYSKIFTPLAIGNVLVMTFEVSNYFPNGPENPAGLAFIADFYSSF